MAFRAMCLRTSHHRNNRLALHSRLKPFQTKKSTSDFWRRSSRRRDVSRVSSLMRRNSSSDSPNATGQKSRCANLRNPSLAERKDWFENFASPSSQLIYPVISLSACWQSSVRKSLTLSVFFAIVRLATLSVWESHLQHSLRAYCLSKWLYLVRSG